MSEGQAVLRSLGHLPRERRRQRGRSSRAVAATCAAVLIVAGAIVAGAGCGPQSRSRAARTGVAPASPRAGAATNGDRTGTSTGTGTGSSVPTDTNAPTSTVPTAPPDPVTTATVTGAAQRGTGDADAVSGDDAVRAAAALHRTLRAALDDPHTATPVVERAIAPGTELLALARADLARVPTLDAPALDLTVAAVRGTGTDLLATDGTRRWVLTVQRWDDAWRLAAILPLLDGPPTVVLDTDPAGSRP